MGTCSETVHIAQSMLFWPVLPQFFVRSACGPACMPRGPSGVGIAVNVVAVGCRYLPEVTVSNVNTQMVVRCCSPQLKTLIFPRVFNVFTQASSLGAAACVTRVTAAARSSLRNASGLDAASGRSIGSRTECVAPQILLHGRCRIVVFYWFYHYKYNDCSH